MSKNIGGVEEDDASSSTALRDRSLVWDCFERLTDQKAKCNACGRVYSAIPSSRTSHLKRHISKCFNRDEPGPPRKHFPLDQITYREMMAESIIKHNYPFIYVEHDKTRVVHKLLHSDVKHYTRNTTKADVLKIYEKEKKAIKDESEKIKSRICLTSDLWTSITSDGYIVLTAHYIDNDWVLRKKVLNFRVMHPPHSGSLLAGCIINFVADWGIEKKVFTITLDNAKYNDGLVEYLKDHLRLNDALLCDGDFMHVRCGAHILNLIVQAGTKVIDEAIWKIRESVKYVKGSAARKIKFAECISHLQLQGKRHVRQDVATRWNSTYLMLDNALTHSYQKR